MSKEPKLVKLIDSFEKNYVYYEAYFLAGGKIMLIDEKGGIIFFGDTKEYLNYKKKILAKSQLNTT